jgi:hypothetical protein
MTISTTDAASNTFVHFPTSESLFKRDFSDLDQTEIEILALAELAWEEIFAIRLPPQNDELK